MFMTSNISRLLDRRVPNTILVIPHTHSSAISRLHSKQKKMGQSIPESTRKLYLKTSNARALSSGLLFGLHFGLRSLA